MEIHSSGEEETGERLMETANSQFNRNIKDYLFIKSNAIQFDLIHPTLPSLKRKIDVRESRENFQFFHVTSFTNSISLPRKNKTAYCSSQRNSLLPTPPDRNPSAAEAHGNPDSLLDFTCAVPQKATVQFLFS